VPKYAPCGTHSTHSCEVIYVLSPNGETYAQGEGWVSGKAAFITIELTLEQKRPDGSWTGIWIDRSGAGKATRHRVYLSSTVDCRKGQYRWHMRVRFSTSKTTYYKTTRAFFAP
jgi:hypothetical protein